MIKVFFCVTKKPGMSDEDFHGYWKDVHGPIAAKIPGIRRYVQHHTAYPTPPIGVPSYDGVAEYWFDDYPSVEEALSSPEMATALADHPNFMADNSACAFFITEEHVVIDGGS
jgi:uncharacterized protein (TIGR02118 family)